MLVRPFHTAIRVTLVAGLALGGWGCYSESDSAPPENHTNASLITVGANVLVSGAKPGWEHTEYMADADPSDPDKVMVCTMLFSPDKNQVSSGVYTSFDGGGNWNLGYDESRNPLTGVWDPACAYGTEGHVFFLTLTHDEAMVRDVLNNTYETWPTVGEAVMPFHRSADGGKTWDASLELGFMDNEDISVDRTHGPYHGRIYLYGNHPPWKDLWLVYSADGGQTFARSAKTEVTDYEAQPGGPGTVLPDGTLLLSYTLRKWHDREALVFNDSLAVAASVDGGQTIGLPVVFLERYDDFKKWNKGPRVPGGLAPFFMASDHSDGPFHGRAYVLFRKWFQERYTLFIVWSDDKGVTWSKPAKVSDERPFLPPAVGPDLFLPTLVVNKDGVLGATWYDRREDPENIDHRLRFSASLDGGETWLPSVPVSEKTFIFTDPRQYPASAHITGGGRRSSEAKTDEYEIRVWPGPRLYEGKNHGMGDYAGIAAGADGDFHTFWIDNRSGVAQMYTAKVTVSGTPTRNGSSNLAELENITSLLELQVTSSVWEAKTQTVTLKFQILNSSETIVKGPLKMRITQVDSDLGTPTLLLADGSTASSGAVFNLTALLPAGGLAPGRTTTTQQLLVDIDPPNNMIATSGSSVNNILQFKAKIFADSGDTQVN